MNKIILKFRNNNNSSYIDDTEIDADVIPRIGEYMSEIQHGQKCYIVDRVEYLYSDDSVIKPIVYLTELKDDSHDHCMNIPFSQFSHIKFAHRFIPEWSDIHVGSHFHVYSQCGDEIEKQTEKYIRGYTLEKNIKGIFENADNLSDAAKKIITYLMSLKSLEDLYTDAQERKLYVYSSWNK